MTNSHKSQSEKLATLKHDAGGLRGGAASCMRRAADGERGRRAAGAGLGGTAAGGVRCRGAAWSRGGPASTRRALRVGQGARAARARAREPTGACAPARAAPPPSPRAGGRMTPRARLGFTVRRLRARLGFAARRLRARLTTTGARAQVLADAREFLRAWVPPPPRAARGAGGAPSGWAAGGAAPGLPRVDFDFACSRVELFYGGGAEAGGGAGLAPLACVSFEGAVLRSERAEDPAGSGAGGGGSGGAISKRDETCPVSTGGGTRRVQLVREGGEGVGGGEVFSGELRALQLALCSCAAPRGPAAGESATGPRLQARTPPPPPLVLSGHAASLTPC